MANSELFGRSFTQTLANDASKNSRLTLEIRSMNGSMWVSMCFFSSFSPTQIWVGWVCLTRLYPLFFDWMKKSIATEYTRWVGRKSRKKEKEEDYDDENRSLPQVQFFSVTIVSSSSVYLLYPVLQFTQNLAWASVCVRERGNGHEMKVSTEKEEDERRRKKFTGRRE